MEINKQFYIQNITYPSLKLAFNKHIYNFIDTSMLEKHRKDYYLRKTEELHALIESMFSIVDIFGSGKDAFVREFTNTIDNQKLASMHFEQKLKAIKDKPFPFLEVKQHGYFYWNFLTKTLDHYAIPTCIPHLTNNRFNDCREFDRYFDLSILCSKLIAIYVPALKRDIKVLDYL